MLPTILVVESNPDLADALRSVLIAHEYSCITINHDPVALSFLKTEPVSMVICELNDLVADNHFLQSLNACMVDHPAKVLYTTCSDIPDHIPASQILQKPFSVETLLEKIKTQTGSISKAATV